jgi:Family of unknown function (DUF6152)
MKKTIRFMVVAGLLCAALISCGTAWAHHSRAMFDQTKQVKLVGTVKDFQWTNPHCWIDVLAPDPSNPSAAPVVWGVEMGAPVELMRKGWKPGSLHPGDKVTILVNPLRDGQHGGLELETIGPDGNIIGHPAVTTK